MLSQQLEGLSAQATIPLVAAYSCCIWHEGLSEGGSSSLESHKLFVGFVKSMKASIPTG